MHVYTMSLLAIGCISKEFIYMQEIQHPTITSDKKKKKKNRYLLQIYLSFHSPSAQSLPSRSQAGEWSRGCGVLLN